MVCRQHAQRSVFEMMLPDGDKLWDAVLHRIDEVLEDEELVNRVEHALARRRPQSRTRGRRGTPRSSRAAPAGAEAPFMTGALPIASRRCAAAWSIAAFAALTASGFRIRRR